MSAAELHVSLYPSGEVAEFRQGDFVEISPDEWVAACPPKHVPKMGWVKWARVEGGLYQPVIQAMPTLVSCKVWSEARYGISWERVRVLAAADFVESVRPTPRVVNIVLESYFAHLKRVKADVLFWRDPEHMRRFLHADRLIKSSPKDEDDDLEAPGGAQMDLDLSEQPPTPSEGV